MSDKKKFGLVMPKRAETVKMRTNSIFGEESDEDGPERKRPKIPQKKLDSKNKIQQELLEDPSIYEYDNIYDEMKSKEAENIAPKEKKNSRYIETLLKAAEKRKKEYEKRVDKKIQAEREKEGDLYKDKESFVTSSYKQKMQEMEEEEERERRQNMLNDMMDITKQKDLSGFYRHFLKQTVGEEKVPVFGEKHIKEELTICQYDNLSNKVVECVGDKKKIDQMNIDQDSDGIDIDSDSEYQSSGTGEEISSKKLHEKENTIETEKYNDENESHINKIKKQTSFKDKSKYFSKRKQLEIHNMGSNKISTEGSDSSDNEVVIATNKDFHSDKNEKLDKHKSREINIQHSRHDSSSSDDNEPETTSDKQEEDKDIRQQNQKKIFTKRTVGDLFTVAQARYFQRIASKNETSS